MSSVEVSVADEITANCEIRPVVNPRTAEVELTFTDGSVLILGFSRRSFKQFMELWPHLQAKYEHAIAGSAG
jgi:hypothetical protein